VRFAGRLLSCGRRDLVIPSLSARRRLLVSYSGPLAGSAVYRCERPNQMLGLLQYFTFGGLRVDAAIAGELFRVVDPMANGAAVEAEQRYWRKAVWLPVSMHISARLSG
jgi:hypothetical protein